MDEFDFDKMIESELGELCVEDHEGIPQWLVEKKKEKAPVIMSILVMTMNTLKLTVERKRYIRHRFWQQLFDSVGEFFRICEVIVPTMGGCDPEYDEKDLPMSFSTKSLDYLTLQELNFETLKVREKKNGSPLWRYEDGEECWLIGMGRKFKTKGDVSLAEYSHDGVFNLAGGRVFDVIEFKAHPYCLFSQKKDWDEGYVILHHAMELKVKRVPTIEILREGRGVWEVYYSEGKWVYLWPRPGKSYVPDLSAAKLMYDTYVSVSVVQSDRASAVYNPAFQAVQSVGDVYNVLLNEKRVVRSHRRPLAQEVVSAKVILYDQTSLYYLDEVGKMFDLVGGKVELGESSEEALLRESIEETGMRVVGASKLGIIERVTNGIVYTTFMYIAPYFLNKPMKNLVQRHGFSLEGVSPWVLDFHKFIRSQIPVFSRMNEVWGQLSAKRVQKFDDLKVVVPVTLSGVVEGVLQAQPMYSDEVRRRLRDLGFPMGRTDLNRLVRGPGSMIKINEEGRMELRKSTDRLADVGKKKLTSREKAREKWKERKRKKKKDVFEDCDDGSETTANKEKKLKEDPPVLKSRIEPAHEKNDERVAGDVPEESDVFFPDFEEYGEEEEMPRYVVSLPDEFLKGIGL